MPPGLFDRLDRWLGRSRRMPPAVLDPCLGDSGAVALRERLVRHEFDAAGQQLVAQADIDRLAHWVNAGSDWPGRPDWIVDWTTRQPDSFWAWLLRGAHGIRWAWEARGNGTADTVSASGQREFHARLDAAAQDLERAQRLNRDSPLPSSFSIKAVMGLQDEIEHIEAVFDHAVELGPAPFGTYLAMQNALTEKWGQSHEAMFGFARRHAGASPTLPMLVAAAHIERYIAFDSAQARQDYARSAPVIEDLRLAFAAFQAPPGSSAAIVGGNYFAFAACMCQQRSAAEAAFRITGPYVTAVPWCYTGDPLERFAGYRRQVLG